MRALDLTFLIHLGLGAAFVISLVWTYTISRSFKQKDSADANASVNQLTIFAAVCALVEWLTGTSPAYWILVAALMQAYKYRENKNPPRR